MRDISELSQDGLPSGKSLIKATIIALAIAGVLLVTTVLPAEYGVDPTGLGRSMGLTVLNEANAGESQPESGALAEPAPLMDTASTGLSPLWKSGSAFRSDEMSLTLQPRQGAEIKALMQQGENFVFHWKAEGGTVLFDMHGERPNAGDEFTSYWLERDQSSASGSFEAPFAGTHGWYWQNNGSEPVTIHLSTAGYYAKLYRP
ncbi:hypothetical protein KQ940_03895 [Marinobacterium sp. D7]|uniref:hypothetical protein n=1 Tax=Marinobacterium ramblicola TaxID=2849041 RepID=UPI001C2CEFFE|nr:hypothetical protein [Marinobacterium ramblicola]MBV1787189.1 hypothetical protein [Marinobacterium ramblicola]